MEVSIIVAKGLALIYVSFAIGLLINPEYYRAQMNKMYDDGTYLILGGFLAIVIGVLILQYHNIWEGNWTLSVTIVGWISLLKGITLLALPKWVLKTRSFFLKPQLTRLIVFLLIIGSFFGYYGFVH